MVWMKTRGLTTAILLLLGLGAGLPRSTWAADPIGRMSLAGRLGVSGYQMGAINDGISRSNQYIAGVEPEWEVPARIHSGFDFVGDVAYDLSNSLRIGLVFTSSRGKTDVDYLQAISVEPTSTMIIPRLFYRLPFRPLIDMSLRLFAGPVFLLGVETTVSHENTSKADHRIETMTIRGSGNGFIAGIMGEYTLSDRFTLAFEGGYRGAKAAYDSGSWTIRELDDPLGDADGDGIKNNQDLLPPSYLWGFLDKSPAEVTDINLPGARTDLDADFSGAIVQIGLRVYLF